MVLSAISFYECAVLSIVDIMILLRLNMSDFPFSEAIVTGGLKFLETPRVYTFTSLFAISNSLQRPNWLFWRGSTLKV